MNTLFKVDVHAEWLSFMEKAVIEAEEAEAELSDDPFESSDDENKQNANALQVLSGTYSHCQTSMQTNSNRLGCVSTEKSYKEHQPAVAFEVMGVVKNEMSS